MLLFSYSFIIISYYSYYYYYCSRTPLKVAYNLIFDRQELIKKNAFFFPESPTPAFFFGDFLQPDYHA